MKLQELFNKLESEPEHVSFSDCIEVIDANYEFTPTAFSNGDTENAEGQNNGSCKIFAFGKKNSLSKEQTLACFGTYYRNDVLKNPEAEDHQNIRNFIKYGWEGVRFKAEALRQKY